MRAFAAHAKCVTTCPSQFFEGNQACKDFNHDLDCPILAPMLRDATERSPKRTE